MQGRRRRKLEDATNNQAEYQGILACFRDALRRPERHICFQVDSMLVAMHMSFRWKCKSATLRDLYREGLILLERLRATKDRIDIFHIHREFNAIADGLANEALGSPGAYFADTWFL